MRRRTASSVYRAEIVRPVGRGSGNQKVRRGDPGVIQPGDVPVKRFGHRINIIVRFAHIGPHFSWRKQRAGRGAPTTEIHTLRRELSPDGRP